MVQRLVSIILLGAAAPACRSLALGESARYYEIWDKAAILYYGEPRNVDGALDLLVHACRKVPEKQDVSCYNLGVLLELEGRKEDADDAYERAWKLHPHPVYENAIAATGAHPPQNGKAVAPLRRLQKGCASADPSEITAALQEIETLADQGAGPHREVLTQPFFSSCLAQNARAAAVTAKLLPAKDHAEASWYRFRARHHPFAGMWDIDLFMRKATAQNKSSHAATAAWQRFLAAAAQNDPVRAGLEIQAFDQAIRTYPAAFRTALRRAAAALIQSDNMFQGVQKDPAVAAFVRSEFGGP